ncbi:uncharacterized protein LOC129004480 [Macrosteles quadrilineatus]|uniref:uncharacterized protein LOC128996023 n=1 Tax=Macrosteles quadrilineatus TaxID=74068 RepID=UPI0023E2BCBE|nr:uncharacterized protein LOC128996023 [Macrosteles quadrilineatus]XP_054288793.1 uncharacterized protein LOC129004291 [Macrosteles quadrilineatus]XP_054289056.1 uncharacterized protein LOC129004480 [Macrosteles quadrilineatus]
MEEAVKTLKEWKHYKESTLKNYFENTWYPEIKRWALAYKPLEMFINSNNGVERLNKELKYTYLEGYKGCSLSEIVSVLLSQFLPERYLTYVRENLTMSSSCRMYSEEIPKYLHGRPKWFVTHVMDRLTSAESLHGCVIVPVSEIHFQIHSTMTYDVNFDLNNRKSSCTCPDFRKERLICKHMIFISIHYQKFDLNLVHELLFDNPIFKCDDELSNYEDENSNNCTIHDKFLDHRHDIEELPLNTHYSELQRRGSNKRHLLNLAKATWRSIESVMWNLDEESLQKGNEILQGCLEFMTSKVSNDESNGLPIQAHEETFNGKSIKRKNYRKLSLHKKQGQSSRVGTTADCLKAARIITITEQDCSPSKRTKIDMLN